MKKLLSCILTLSSTIAFAQNAMIGERVSNEIDMHNKLLFSTGQKPNHNEFGVFANFEIEITDDYLADLDSFEIGLVDSNFTPGRLQNRTKYTTFYKRAITKAIGNELGFDILDLYVQKTLLGNENKGLSFLVSLQGSAGVNFATNLNQENSLFDGYELRKMEDALTLSGGDLAPKIEISRAAILKYIEGDSELALELKQENKRSSHNSENHYYQYNGKASAVKIKFTPNKNKCHSYSLGLTKYNHSQEISLHDFSNERKHQEKVVEAKYECKFN